MNEKGLAICVLKLDGPPTRQNSKKAKITTTSAMRMVLDKSSNVGEALKLLENYEVIMNAIIKAKPAAAKGQYIKSVALTTTMGPSIFINQK